MDAIVITEPGGPEVLQLKDIPDPECGPDDVIIAVTASGVNRADLLQRRGHYPPPKGAPEHPGLECSGTIIKTGDNVGRWKIGDNVCALLPGGGYAKRVAVHSGLVLSIPHGISAIDAAGLPEVAATVWSNVIDVAGLRFGDKVLIHGGAGGIGTFAIQFAKMMGARTIVTTARREHESALRELGADVVVDYRSEDFVGACRDIDGVDIILDNMGASYLDRNIAALARNGRIVTIGLQGGTTAELDISSLLVKSASLRATGMRGRSLAERIAIMVGVERQVWPYVESGAISLRIAERFPLADAADAHRLIEAGGHLGKVLLTT